MINFKNISFEIEEDKLYLTDIGNAHNLKSGIAEVHISGGMKKTHRGIKLCDSSEGYQLKYVSHNLTENKLEILQESPNVSVTTAFQFYEDTNAVRVFSTVTNISEEDIVLEEVSSLCFEGIGGENRKLHPETMYFTRFLQSHHTECQPRESSFKDYGIYAGSEGQKKICGINIGSWSTKEELPRGIIEDKENSDFLMFQIESMASWYYEISDKNKNYYLWLGGPSLSYGSWEKKLKKGQSYTTPAVCLSFGKSLNEVVGEMTKYRRHIAKNSKNDEFLPSIFNEYMHLSWDNPTAENTARVAPIVARTGIEYYVIDCGWHNEEPGWEIYPYIGHWKESHARFPEGLRKTTDFIRSYGMKPGLWIEPESVGILCKEMQEFYTDDCFLQRNGKRITISGRQFLDYRNEKVRNYMTETIRRMVEDYGAEYIKFDYNYDCGAGTDYMAFSLGEGLEMAADAFLIWTKEMCERFPEVVFEGCASGGMRLDYKTLSAFSLVSTSDQSEYLQYPFIAGNILSAVLPEQAAVWSYPVTDDCKEDAVVPDKRIVLNMINSFLGRMHLASHLERLNESQLQLIREGIAYYNSISEFKKKALPYFPIGFTGFGESKITAGIKYNNKLCLAVWLLGDERKLEIPIEEGIEEAKIVYPANSSSKIELYDNKLIVSSNEADTAVFIELKTNR
ncbi:MAG: alpha-galactosidase [Clostridia bacterium]|nr:alpha-galactosidase [Clostridia bacterium]